MKLSVSIKSYLAKDAKGFELNSEGLSRWIGYCAVGLPLVMLYGVYFGWPFGRVCFAKTISHFYYTRGFGDIFVGILFFIAIFLYNFSAKKQIDTRCATVAGLCALGVALFPTAGAPCVYDMEQTLHLQARLLTDMPHKDAVQLPNSYTASTISSRIHVFSAALLFSFLAWFSLCVFTRDDQDKKYLTSEGELTDVKILRNKIYKACGYIILGAIVIIAASEMLDDKTRWDGEHLTFWLEAVALIAFGASWMVHGRSFEAFKD